MYTYIHIYIHVDRHTYIYIYIHIYIYTLCVGDTTIGELRMLDRWIPWDDLQLIPSWRFPKPAGDVFF